MKTPQITWRLVGLPPFHGSTDVSYLFWLRQLQSYHDDPHTGVIRAETFAEVAAALRRTVAEALSALRAKYSTVPDATFDTLVDEKLVHCVTTWAPSLGLNAPLSKYFLRALNNALEKVLAKQKPKPKPEPKPQPEEVAEGVTPELAYAIFERLYDEIADVEHRSIFHAWKVLGLTHADIARNVRRQNHEISCILLEHVRTGVLEVFKQYRREHPELEVILTWNSRRRGLLGCIWKRLGTKERVTLIELYEIWDWMN